MRITISIDASAWELAELAYRILHTRAELVAPRPTAAARYGNESPTAKYMLLPTPEQAEERRRKLEYEAECEAARIRQYGSWAGGWSS